MFLFKDIKELICIVKKGIYIQCRNNFFLIILFLINLDNLYISQPNDLKKLSEKELNDKTEKLNPSNIQSTLELLDIDSREKDYFTVC